MRGQLIAPPQPAGLAGPPRDGLAYKRPIPGTMPLHQPLQRTVLIRAPRPLYPIDVFAAAAPRCRHHGIDNLPPHNSIDRSERERERTKERASRCSGVYRGAESQGLVTALAGRLVVRARPLPSSSGGLAGIQLAVNTRRPLAAPVIFLSFPDRRGGATPTHMAFGGV